MYTYEIKQDKSQPPQRTSNPADVKDRQALFDKHYTRFWGEIGSQVAFKRPKKTRDIWTVAHIEKDIEKIKWSNDGWIPNYIQLQMEVHSKGKEPTKITCWTCENKLKSVGVRHGNQAGSRR